jgi:hypothetical protein
MVYNGSKASGSLRYHKLPASTDSKIISPAPQLLSILIYCFSAYLPAITTLFQTQSFYQSIMKFIASASLFFLLGVASAFPTALEDRAEPSNSPIDVRPLKHIQAIKCS